MSQWNNTYTYNNQYQASNNWNSDPNGQYVNQAYYNRQLDPSGNQYVSFNEFISQMQVSGVPAVNTAQYNNVQYQNYPPSQYSNVGNYQNIPANQNAQVNYGYGANSSNYPNNVESYQSTSQAQYNPALEPQSYTSDMVSKSKLTPTATEFVPKSSQKPTNSKNEPTTEQQEVINGVSEASSIPTKPSESKNWRERPQSNSQSTSSHNTANGYDNPDTSYRGEQKTYNRPSSHHEANGGPSNRYENKNRKYESNGSQNSYSNKSESSNNLPESSRNSDSSTYKRNKHETNSNSDSHNRNDHYREGGQGKSTSKGRNKELDPSRTFYNSKQPKDSQDVRNGRGEGSGRQRHWAGSQRLRAAERNSIEDEQYASSYLHYREERSRVQRDNHMPSPSRNKKAVQNNNNNNSGGNKEMTQRERLVEQLDKGTLECLVCCERVKQIDPVWYCSNCYHVLHLRCIRKWAVSSMVEGKWRCPACQNTSQDIPTEYRCMCGAIRNPEYQRGSNGAHTCGKACKRPRNCPHPCTLLCHPGPCPPCQATISKKCGCGAETRSVLCSSKLAQECGRQCNRLLNCQTHVCTKDCHEGPCEPCAEIVEQICYCPAAKSRSVPCTADTGGEHWSCGAECARVLACGAHVCRAACHPPPCAACPLRPDNVPTCPCGNTRLKDGQRKMCTDPIPLCGNICNKSLPCGHFCKEKCHEDACRVCPDTTTLQCRCGHSTRDVPCPELPDMYNNVLCTRKCNKKLSCGRHRCRTACCAAQSHRCAVVCGRTLSCQLHRCEDFCHTGHCAPCPRLDFEELRCECGLEVILPPVRCGAKPPPCSAPCRRERPCGHAPHHTCHSGDCPPCVVLTTKMCHGRHEERKTIPCSQEEFSCGLPCGKPLPCGKHTCIKTCHKGPCDTDKCNQPCNEKRATCGHPCAAPCHASNGGPCPSGGPCRRPVRATCPCARRRAERACCDNARDYAKILNALAATKIQEGGSVDLSDAQRPSAMLKTLECDDECRQEARSRQLALALQIRNPDVSAKLAPRYSDTLRAMAAREPSFAHHVHDKLTDLVQLAKKSKQKTRAHSFPSMNRQKRQFIHEMCEHFGCESVAYDAEPNRNVVATADKEKSWLPAMSVLEVLAREAGKRRVPGPVLRAPPPHTTSAATTATNTAPSTSKSFSGWATLTSTNAWASRSQPSTSTKPEPKEAKIDYFDNPPEN
ncbi:protein shuttle craft [Colias croceus]|uniref:protein shuttle craft n=1 Tax=Colias crocea TaxID=72248 RepID=UPI001E27F5EC|nr:protein shuttle craft [Colias croceus]